MRVEDCYPDVVNWVATSLLAPCPNIYMNEILRAWGMPNIRAFAHDIGSLWPEFDLGDRNGATCSPAVCDADATFLLERGNDFTIHTSFADAGAVSKYGGSQESVHGLQTEMNRDLFTDDARRVSSERMDAIRGDMRRIAPKVTWLSDGPAA